VRPPLRQGGDGGGLEVLSAKSRKKRKKDSRMKKNIPYPPQEKNGGGVGCKKQKGEPAEAESVKMAISDPPPGRKKLDPV
jgi:hypothetical protein